MKILHAFSEGEVIVPSRGQNGLSLKIKLLFGLIPSVVIILMVTGYITYLTSSHFLNQALERSTRLQVKAMSHEIETILARCRMDLLFIAQTAEDETELQKIFAGLVRASGLDYRELGFIAQNAQDHAFWVAGPDGFMRIPVDDVAQIHPDPLLHSEHLVSLKPGEVWMSPVVEVVHPFQTPENPNQRLHSHVIYFGTPCELKHPDRRGYLLLSLDIRFIRNVLSLFNSPQSPLLSYPRMPALRYAYLFDPEGWILFQNEGVDKTELELTTDLARSTYESGILGKPGLPSAFRPSPDFPDFWQMVGDVNKGRHDLMVMDNSGDGGSSDKKAFLAYAPVRFQGAVVAGLAYVDRTHFTRMAGYKHLDIMLVITVLTIAAISVIIFILAHRITKPIYQLAGAVNRIQDSAQLQTIHIPSRDYEVSLLVAAINRMIAALNAQMAEIREKEMRIKTVEYKERIQLESEFPREALPGKEMNLPEIIGFGTKIEQLRSDILKAAGSDADVLIIGETGTGKQLAAEAIHRHSRRSAHPFISVNCGELGETLLLDSLFGHLKGAYTEAKADRKGAFQEAHRGTLFLDEIQNASLTVQQALLRAVSVRKVKPLGSDKEVDVDVRLICATNADLTLLIERRMFRADLYFRLKVITIHPPPLRDQKQNIPVLVNHLLRHLEASTQRTGLGVSRGALEKLKQYHWPGNIRELNNCITRAVIMTESRIIQADDIILEEGLRSRTDASGTGLEGEGPDLESPMRSGGDRPASPAPSGPGRIDPGSLPFRMNSRQEKAYPYILSQKRITRADYMNWVGADISPRTAVYDLQDLVRKGVLRKEGSGPATRYILVEG